MITDLYLRVCKICVAATVATSLLAVTTQESFAHSFKVGSITIDTPWARATPGGAKVAAGYLTIKNEGATPDRLVSVTAEIAERTELHQMIMEDGVMKMRQVTDGLPVPAGGSVVLEPNSYHLMFMELKRPLKEGEQFQGTLVFEQAGKVAVTFDVEPIGASAPKAGDLMNTPLFTEYRDE
jgi:copper(I)-binding protein